MVLDEQNGEFPIKSVRKAMAILDALSSARRPLRVIDLSKQLKMSVSAVSRLVTTLSSGGLVYQDEDTDRCYLGLGLTVLGSDALGRRELDRIAMPVLDELVHRTRCYVSLSRFMRGRAVIMRARTTSLSPRDLNLISVVPLHACAPGKILAGAFSEEEIRTLLVEHGMDPFTSKTIVNSDQFLSDVEEAKQRGFAIDDEEIAYNLRHVATAIYDSQGNVTAAISAGGNLSDIPMEEIAEVIRTLHNGGLRISRELGFKGSVPLSLESIGEGSNKR
jgi:DNA-binding IclR family transcriptional regulator